MDECRGIGSRDSRVRTQDSNSGLARLRQLLSPNSSHNINFVITGGAGGCQNDNLWYHQWRQSCHHDSSLFSVTWYLLLRSVFWANSLFILPDCEHDHDAPRHHQDNSHAEEKNRGTVVQLFQLFWDRDSEMAAVSNSSTCMKIVIKFKFWLSLLTHTVYHLTSPRPDVCISELDQHLLS